MSVLRRLRVLRGDYVEPDLLLQIARAASRLDGVDSVRCVSGTRAALGWLTAHGFAEADALDAEGADLVIAIAADDQQAMDRAEAQVLSELRAARRRDAELGAAPSLEAALEPDPRPNFALLSVRGPFAVREVRRALSAGMHVMLQSDALTLDQEVELKDVARAKGRLLLGPRCNAAIIDGTPIGFANRVERGPIGVVGATGSGLQELTCLIDRWGSGISHALGVGGRDLSAKVKGVGLLSAFDVLERDPSTEVIALLSKPPSGTAKHRVLDRVRQSRKRVVCCFLGAEDRAEPPLVFAPTIEAAARAAVLMVAAEQRVAATPTALRAAYRTPRFSAWQRDLVGLFAGGTLAYEALAELSPVWDVSSNLPFSNVRQLDTTGHRVIDFGSFADDELGYGEQYPALHPIADLRPRARAIAELAEDARVAVCLFDVLLGPAAHPDPMAELGPAIRAAQRGAERRGGELAFVASVVGTDKDPQSRLLQAEALAQLGVNVAASNAAACRLAGSLLQQATWRVDPPPERSTEPAGPLLGQPLEIVTVGLDGFATALEQSGASTRRVGWKPPAGGDEELARILDELSS